MLFQLFNKSNSFQKNLSDTVEYDKIIEQRQTKRLPSLRDLSPTESSDVPMGSEDEVKLRLVLYCWDKQLSRLLFRFNRHYRRSQSVEPAKRKSRTTNNSKRTRTSQFEYIDEESENNEVSSMSINQYSKPNTLSSRTTRTLPSRQRSVLEAVVLTKPSQLLPLLLWMLKVVDRLVEASKFTNLVERRDPFQPLDSWMRM